MKAALWSDCGFFGSGFAELQTDMTDLTKELNRSQGIPFLEYKYFVTRTFFPKVRQCGTLNFLIMHGFSQLYTGVCVSVCLMLDVAFNTHCLE